MATLPPRGLYHFALPLALLGLRIQYQFEESRGAHLASFVPALIADSAGPVLFLLGGNAHGPAFDAGCV